MKKICDPEKFPVERLNQAKDQKPTFQRSDENSSESISFFVKRINSNEHEKPFNNRRKTAYSIKKVHRAHKTIVYLLK